MKWLGNNKLTITQPDIAALDIGCSKIACAIGNIANKDDNPHIQILGAATHGARGLKCGNITHLKELEESILATVNAAEQQAKKTIKKVYVSIPSSLLCSEFVQLRLPLNGQPVTNSHVNRIADLAKKQFNRPGRQLIHLFALHYSVDSIHNVTSPISMVGENLVAHLHLITAPNHFLANLAIAVGKCHLDIAAFVAANYAASFSTIVNDEKQMGVTLIEMGASNISFISFVEGLPVWQHALPLGGCNITLDIAQGLNINIAQAERLKTLYGNIIGESDDKETVLINTLGDYSNNFNTTPIAKTFLLKIIKARADELIEIIQHTLQSHKIDKRALQRFVLTGGCSQLQGMREAIGYQLKRPIRFAPLLNIKGGGEIAKTPCFAGCAGLLNYAIADQNQQQLHLNNNLGSRWRSTFKRIKNSMS